jgi:hypothetical protein
MSVLLFPAGLILGILAMYIPYREVNIYLRHERASNDRWREYAYELESKINKGQSA